MINKSFNIPISENPEGLQAITGMIQNVDNVPTLSVFLSQEKSNEIYSGNFFQAKKPGELKKLEENAILDFRKISILYYLRDDLMLMNIKGMSYYVGRTDNRLVVKPWKGVNGDCNNSLRLRLRRYQNVVLCHLGGNKFYIKYVVGLRTKTGLVTVDTGISDALDNSQVIKMKKSNLLETQIYIVIRDQEGSLKVLIADLSVFHAVEMSLYRISEILQKDFSVKDYFEGFKDISIVNEQLLIMHLLKDGHYITVLEIGNSSTLTLMKRMRLPDNIEFTAGSKFRVSIGNPDKDYNFGGNHGFDDMKQHNYYVGFMVKVKKFEETVDKISKKKYLAIFDPKDNTINSISLVYLPPNYKLLLFGNIIMDYEQTNSLNFVILAQEIISETTPN